jgi:hypothetical protein
METTHQQAITSLDDYDELVEGYIDRGETDGFPIVPPYPAGVDALVAGSGRPADAVLGKFAHRPTPVTVREIAEQSLMAGCLPEYMPLVITAFEILLEPEFGTDRWAASEGGYFPWVLVNGPIRARLNINGKHNVMGPGARANSCIGRALRLGLINLGGFKQGATDRSTVGTAFKWAAVVPEDEEGSPWPPYHTDLGFQKDDSTVTLVVGFHPHHFTHQLSQVPEQLLLAYGEELSSVGYFSAPSDAADPLFDLSDEQARQARGAVIFIAEDHRAYFHAAGWSKQRLRQFLAERVGRHVRDLRAAGIDGPHGAYAALHDDVRISMFASPEQIIIYPTGSGGGRAMPGLTYGKPVTRKIEALSTSVPVLSSSKASPIAQYVVTLNRYFERGATDGHPIIPPTVARLEAMLAAAGGPPDEVLRTKWGFVDAVVTVRDLAVNALMAGCRPEHMPLLITAFSLRVSIGASTGAHMPSLIVNGPVRKRLGISSVFGPGARANAVIGRAIVLTCMNVGRERPAVTDKSSLGKADKYNFGLIGENEEDSPWEPLHTVFGFAAEDSTVTAMGDHSLVSVNHEGTTAREVLRAIIEDLSTAQIFDAPTVNQGGQAPVVLRDRRHSPTVSAGMSGGGGGAIVYFGGRHRDVLRREGWSRRDVQEYIAEHLGRTIGEIRSRGYEGRRVLPEQSGDEFIGRVADPTHVVVLSAGGRGSYSVVNRAMPGQVIIGPGQTGARSSDSGIRGSIARIPD